MKNSAAVLSIKFQSSHSPADLLTTCNEDLERFKNVPGLIEKYYITEEGTDAISGIYLFATDQDREAFWNSELAKDIPVHYKVKLETLRVERFQMAIVLNDSMPVLA